MSAPDNSATPGTMYGVRIGPSPSEVAATHRNHARAIAEKAAAAPTVAARAEHEADLAQTTHRLTNNAATRRDDHERARRSGVVD